MGQVTYMDLALNNMYMLCMLCDHDPLSQVCDNPNVNNVGCIVPQTDTYPSPPLFQYLYHRYITSI